MQICHLREIGPFAVEPAKVEKAKCQYTMYVNFLIAELTSERTIWDAFTSD